MAAATTPSFSITEFLAAEREKDLLRFSTAGSVDDGKSTLIACSTTRNRSTKIRCVRSRARAPPRRDRLISRC
jgi:translation elongation factor EF-Tu-like GTPase